MRGKIFTILKVIFALSLFLPLGCSSSSSKNGSVALKTDSALVSGTLKNGMSYYVLQNGEPKNRIMLRLIVKAGSNMEEDDQKGVAHFVEHLAFNGSEHFEKNSLVDYFESIGMNYGADLNAYTSFEETVFKLEVPADDIEMLKTGLLVLHDWACSLTFDQTELDKERGVIVEEWRLSQGADGRATEKIVPFLLKDSRYAERLPIGDMDIIREVSRERVIDFYKKWYRPELMSVVVVGDAKASVLEKAVKEALSTVPASSVAASAPSYTVPFRTQKDAILIKDKEFSSVDIEIMSATSPLVIKTEEDLRESIINSMLSSIINERLQAITTSSSSPWVSAEEDSGKMTRSMYLQGLLCTPKQGKALEAFKLMLDELDRLKKFGVLEGEVSRKKSDILSYIEQSYNNRENKKNSSFVSAITEYILSGSAVISEESRYTLYNKIIPSITKEDIDNAAAAFLEDRGTMLIVEAPENETDLPSKDAFVDVWKNYSNSALEPYEEEEVSASFAQKPSKAASISSSFENKELGATVYTLSNGIRVICKKTDFSKDKIQLYAYNKGGASLFALSDYPSASVACDYALLSGINGMTYSQMAKALSGKRVSLRCSINSYGENFVGSSSAGDVETLIELVYAFMTSPQFTDEGWNTLKESLEQTASNHGNSPEDVFEDKITELVFNNDIRYSAITKDFVSKINKKKAEAIYKKCFSDASGFTFIFTGDFAPDALMSLCASYLGNLSASSKVPASSLNEPAFPKGIKEAVVKKGLDPQSSVLIAFGGTLDAAASSEANWVESNIISSMGSLLDMRLREVLREELGGTYGVSVYAGINGLGENSERSYEVQIMFGCEPGREKELIESALGVIKEVQEKGAEDSYLVKIRETYRRNKETSLRNETWWQYRLKDIFVDKDIPASSVYDSDTVPNAVTSASLKEASKKYCPLTNYATVILMPEI